MIIYKTEIHTLYYLHILQCSAMHNNTSSLWTFWWNVLWYCLSCMPYTDIWCKSTSKNTTHIVNQNYIHTETQCTTYNYLYLYNRGEKTWPTFFLTSMIHAWLDRTGQGVEHNVSIFCYYQVCPFIYWYLSLFNN